MTLIKCSKCGKKISNKASKCIHCGCPIKKKKGNTLSNKTILYTIIVLIIIVVIAISCSLSGGTNNSKNNDTNEIKVVCNYNAYDFQEKIDGYNLVLLNGNSKSTKITTHEKRKSAKKNYNCKKILKEIVEKYGNNTYCTDDFSASGSEYKLLYIYDVNEDINKKVNELKKQNYECITYYNKNDSVVNNNIIGSWCGKDTLISPIDVKYTFNEDGTGKEDDTYNFYYEVKGNMIYRTSEYANGNILKMVYNENEDVIYTGAYSDSKTGEILQDKNKNTALSRCN